MNDNGLFPAYFLPLPRAGQLLVLVGQRLDQAVDAALVDLVGEGAA
jgi:hypothetical protein